MSILHLVVTFLGALFKSQRQLTLENLALRQQVSMLRQSVKRPRATVYGWPNPYPLEMSACTTFLPSYSGKYGPNFASNLQLAVVEPDRLPVAGVISRGP
jgi:hypothetical protein